MKPEAIGEDPNTSNFSDIAPIAAATTTRPQTPNQTSDDEQLADRTHDLIGDGSQPYALPTLKIAHDRFKRIDATTLVNLINGGYKDSVESFTIIDCRYPYEYEGGHIVNAINIHTGSDLINFFLENSTMHRNSHRHIIIFHCEFSSERGPKLMRLLREKDRQINKYPQLIHPEIYLLQGGYKDFFKRYKEYCVPQSYKPMKSRNHRDELRNFRKRRKMANPRRKENRTPDISFEGC